MMDKGDIINVIKTNNHAQMGLGCCINGMRFSQVDGFYPVLVILRTRQLNKDARMTWGGIPTYPFIFTLVAIVSHSLVY